MTGLMMKDALVMRKTLRLYALFLLFYSGLAVLGVFPMSMALFLRRKSGRQQDHRDLQGFTPF